MEKCTSAGKVHRLPVFWQHYYCRLLEHLSVMSLKAYIEIWMLLITFEMDVGNNLIS